MDGSIAAAVCYRLNNNTVEFLLVRTTGGKHWTFPKGHIKTKLFESPWAAAQREAGEEAGVVGTVETELLTHYLYRKRDKEDDDLVVAYLMRVEPGQQPCEEGRDPQWLTPEMAMKKLAKGRSKKQVTEHHQVICKALCKLREQLKVSQRIEDTGHL